MPSYQIPPLASLVSKADVVERTTPYLTRIKPGSSPEQVVAQALAMACEQAQALIARELNEQLGVALVSVVGLHVMMEGERPELPGEEQQDWDGALDDAIATSLEGDVLKLLGPSAMGELTVDTRAHTPAEVTALAGRLSTLLSERMRKQFATDARFMSAVGVVGDELVKLRNKKGEKPKPAADIAFAIETIQSALDMGLEPAELAKDLDDAGDDEEALALGACQRLAGDDWQRFRASALGLRAAIGGPNWATVALETPPATVELMQADTEADQDKHVEAKLPVAKKSQERKGRVDKSHYTDEQVMQGLLLLRQFGNVAEADLAEGMGVSRSTVNNYVNGKKPLKASNKIGHFLASEIDKRIRGLQQGLDVLGAPNAEDQGEAAE